MQKLLLAGLLLVFVIIALILETKNFGGFQTEGSTVTLTPSPVKKAQLVPTNIIAFSIKNKKIASVSSNIQAPRDTEIVFHIIGDTSSLFTIDKYGQSVILQKGKQVTLSIVTTEIGSFVIRLAGIPIGILHVQP